MKQFIVVLMMLAFISCASGKGRSYTGSTPAGLVVRSFLGIPQTDSIDFIRWLLEIDGNSYKLDCSYGIGKPNTNGFINGRQLKISGQIKKEKNIYCFLNQGRELKLAELNNALLHPLDENNNLLIGTAGWSYTLCNLNPLVEPVNVMTESSLLVKDSASYVGRTPCGIPGLTKELCYKLKWHIVFYPGTGNDESGQYRAVGTLYRDGQLRGNWRARKTENGLVQVELLNEKNLPFLYFIKGSEQVLFITDSKGKLLVGNEDFSFTLNREK